MEAVITTVREVITAGQDVINQDKSSSEPAKSRLGGLGLYLLHCVGGFCAQSEAPLTNLDHPLVGLYNLEKMEPVIDLIHWLRRGSIGILYFMEKVNARIADGRSKTGKQRKKSREKNYDGLSQPPYAR
jgi:hypothetical protein